jgi:pyruvate dehydrogenase E1 component alpha subunit
MTAGEGVSARARALAIPSLKVDGNDVQAVDEAAARLIAEVRAGGGPRFLHAVTYRFKGHVSVDPGTYRNPEEVAAAKLADPLLVAAAKLAAEGVSQAVIERIDDEARAEIEHALRVAEAAPWPQAGAAYEDVQSAGAAMWQ